MPLSLHVPAHEPERKPGFAIAVKHGRNNRVEGSFPSLETVRMFWIEREQRPAIVEHYSRTGDNDSRAEIEIKAVDK